MERRRGGHAPCRGGSRAEEALRGRRLLDEWPHAGEQGQAKEAEGEHEDNGKAHQGQRGDSPPPVRLSFWLPTNSFPVLSVAYSPGKGLLSFGR